MKQDVIINQGRDIVVQNGELVHDKSGGLKIGGLAGDSFKHYEDLPPLLLHDGEAEAAQLEDSLHLRLISAGLKKGNTLRFDEVIYSYEGEQPSGVWVGRKFGETWYYSNKFDMGVMVKVAVLVKYWGGVDGKEKKITVNWVSGKTDGRGVDVVNTSSKTKRSGGDDGWSETIYYGLGSVRA